MKSQSDVSKVTRESLNVSSVHPPGWAPSEGRVPDVGQFVYCLEGPAKVVQVLGRTGDGGRLLELLCEDRRAPFFASSANVLLQSTDPRAPEGRAEQDDGSEP